MFMLRLTDEYKDADLVRTRDPAKCVLFPPPSCRRLADEKWNHSISLSMLEESTRPRNTDTIITKGVSLKYLDLADLSRPSSVQRDWFTSKFPAKRVECV